MVVVTVHTFISWLAGAFFWFLLRYCCPELADGCLALVQLVPMGCPVKEDGSVVTWGSCTSRWVFV